jgi:hypothetical protein
MRNIPVESVAIAQAITYDNSYFWDPIVFQTEFNEHRGSLTLNRAWLLFLTADQGDKFLGFSPEAGRFLPNLLIVIGATVSIWAIIFNHV